MDKLPIDRQDLPTHTYCVGGWVRDNFLGREKFPLDLDFVLPQNPIEVARAIAHKYRGGFVILDREREIARVVLPMGNFDFAKQVGNSIADDLHRRDFCMNAIAISVHDPTEIIDPLGGMTDIDRGVVRMVAPENIYDDPLRVLRAYRQAAQLNFVIEPWTLQTIKELAPHLKGVAIERIRMELGYLLQIPRGTPWLIDCLEAQILSPWLPPDRLELVRFSQMDWAMETLVAKYPDLHSYFQRELIVGQTIGATAKYASLVASATMLDGLGLSRIEQKWIGSLLRHLGRLWRSSTTLEQYQLFEDAGETLPALVSIGLASGLNIDYAHTWLDRWLDPHDPIAHPPALLTGDDLQQELGLKPGPKLGQLLAKIKQAQACAGITDRAAALEFAKQWCQNPT